MRPTPILCLVAGLGLSLAIPPGAAGGPEPSPNQPAGKAPSVEWLEYGDALDRARQENKHLLVDFYTNWCGWCKVMDKNTYGDSTVATYLRDHFVLTKVNAESPKRIRVGDGTKSGIELARDYGVGSFPITWFVKPDGNRLDRIMGYVPPDRFHKALVYVHERGYEKSR
jgi:thioredoxin-related protein